MPGFIAELRRRNVFKVATLYVVGAWLVLQISDVAFPLFQWPDSGVRIIASILALGFIPVVVFSWIYEFTPQGLVREDDVPPEATITRRTGRRIDQLTIVALMSVIALLLAERFWPDGEPPASAGDSEFAFETAPPTASASPAVDAADVPDQSVAVLPFVNMSPDADNEYFAAGLSETLLHQLAQVKNLKVPARTSSFAFRGMDMDVRDIGRELGVAHLLEGSVQRADDRVRITAQLVDARTGDHLWSKSFDRDFEDIFAIQDEIAEVVLEKLSITLLAEEADRFAGAPTVDLEAFEELVKGQQAVARRTAESLERAETHFRRAIERDPDYAEAYVGLGTVYQLQIEYSDRPIGDAASDSEPLARKAIELDPALADAHALLGIVLSSQNRPEEAETAFLRAIELNPNLATAYHWYSLVLNQDFRFEEALQVIRKAEELDPLSHIIQHNVAVNLTTNGRIEEAMAHLRRNIERNPEFPNYFMQLGVIQRFVLGRMDEAMANFLAYNELNPGNINAQSMICTTWAELKNDLEAKACIEDLIDQAPDKLGPRFSQAQLALLRGEPTAAGDILSGMIETNPNLPGARRFRAMVRAAMGQPDLALDDIAQTDPELLAADPRVDVSNFGTAVIAGYALRLQGDIERSDRLFDDSLDVMGGLHRTRGPSYGALDMVVHALRGDEEAALVALREAIDAGWRNNWRMLEIAPQLEGLRERPEFQAMVAELEADVLTQRSRLEDTSAALL